MDVVDQILTKWTNKSVQSPTKKHIRILGDLEIHLSKSGRDSRVIRLNSVKSLKRGKKNFSKFISWLISEAEHAGVSISLAVDTFDSWYKDDCLSREQLRAFFEKRGFEVRFRYPDEAGYEMIKYSN